LARYLELPSQVGLGPLTFCAENSKTVFHRAPARAQSVLGQSVVIRRFIGTSKRKPRRSQPTRAS
jgi:hypothetical protein